EHSAPRKAGGDRFAAVHARDDGILRVAAQFQRFPDDGGEVPVLPAVQDAKLIQTGTSGWLADLMLGAGMVLSAAGYWMERKRKAMFYKSQH
ncbi:hypothetical protein, partial [Faecalibacterium prausnitzii]|uniref:hypothetical protein n=1 Tax=Faecalibacterium prausnitzii TaxID=853 RepID=UPI0018CC4041